MATDSKHKAPPTAWKAGQSGNPSGRPKESYHVRDLARQYTDEAINTLVKIMRLPVGKDRGRASGLAATALLDRGWGRPIQEISGPDGGPIQIDYAKLTSDQLRDVRTKLAEVQATLLQGPAAAVTDAGTGET